MPAPTPKPRVTIRQLVLAIAAMAAVNGLGANMDRPLGTGPGTAPDEGRRYFDSPESVREQALVAEHRVGVLQVVTILVGNTFVLTVLCFCVFANYLEDVRVYRSGTGARHHRERTRRDLGRLGGESLPRDADPTHAARDPS